MYNRRYENVFLMLRQETAGYGIGKRQPWGSCVMELKNGSGRLHLTVQGLKPLLYEAYVMAGEESIFCGELRPEAGEGRGELKWDFVPDAVGAGKKGRGFSYGDPSYGRRRCAADSIFQRKAKLEAGFYAKKKRGAAA